MKKAFYSLFILAMAAVLFSGCDKNGNPIDPNPGGGGSGDHAELWHYDAPIKGLADIIPAIDGSGNIYFAGQEEGAAGGTSHVISVDKNGKERWSVAFDESSPTHVMVADDKLFFGFGDPVKIYALNASDGSVIWSKDLSSEYDFDWWPVMAYANHKLYVGSGQLTEGFVFAYNPSDGNELWITRLYDKITISMAVKGDHIYVDQMGSIVCFKDNGSSADSLWSWEEPGKASRSALEGNIAISDNGNIYYRSDQNQMNIISGSTGETITSIVLDETFNNSASSATVDGEGNFYIGNGNMNKFSADGSIVWTSDINSGLINPSFSAAPLIGENGNLYNADLFSLTSVKPDGTLDWMLGTTDGVGNLHVPTIDNDGNIITYATEKGTLYCYKGDGSKLATQGWPKRYGDMGNTSSN